jgi:hypothetical protein
VTSDGFNQLLSIMSSINDTKAWTCKICDEKLEETVIDCDYCNEWFHLKCIGIKSEPKLTKWFCSECKTKH